MNWIAEEVSRPHNMAAIEQELIELIKENGSDLNVSLDIIKQRHGPVSGVDAFWALIDEGVIEMKTDEHLNMRVRIVGNNVNEPNNSGEKQD